MRTVTAVAIHNRGDSPVFGESVTTVRLEDEAAGPFLLVEQSQDAGLMQLRLDLDELCEITDAARWLLEQPGAKGGE
jgi:outer membrane autotransporter protein